MIVKNFKNLNSKDYEKIADILKKDEIIIYPTETIYGIGGNALSKKVIEKIVKIKKRDMSKKFIWLFKDLNMIEKFMKITEFEKSILKKYSQGGLTIILNKKENEEKVACRVSTHPFVLNIFEFIDFPLISTSANISNKKYEHSFEKILSNFKKDIFLFIVDRKLFNIKPLPSTIIEVKNSKKIVILRQGKVKIA